MTLWPIRLTLSNDRPFSATNSILADRMRRSVCLFVWLNILSVVKTSTILCDIYFLHSLNATQNIRLNTDHINNANWKFLTTVPWKLVFDDDDAADDDMIGVKWNLLRERESSTHKSKMGLCETCSQNIQLILRFITDCLEHPNK